MHRGIARLPGTARTVEQRIAAAVLAAGWIVMRLTYRAIVSDPSDTARRIRRAVSRWSHLDPPSTDHPPTDAR